MSRIAHDVNLYETWAKEYDLLAAEAELEGDLKTAESARRCARYERVKIQRLKDGITFPFEGALGLFNKRSMTRNEYRFWDTETRKRMARRDWLSGPIFQHFEDAKKWVRWVARCENLWEGDMFLYHALTEGYAARIDEAIADWGGSMWEAELERAVSSYHFWGDSGGLRIS